jgi:GntR family transcriptional regulator
LDLIVSQQSPVPAYAQITSQIKALILGGVLPAGALLPSVRGLARDLKVSHITTIRAYADLENEGLVTTVQGRGSFVSRRPQKIVRQQYLAEIEENIANIAAKGVAAGLTLPELQKKLEETYHAAERA